MSSTGDWRALRHNEECPVCRHRGWCTVAPAGDAIGCRRVPRGRAIQCADGTQFWLHPVPEGEMPKAASLPPKARPPKKSHAEWQVIWKQHRSALNPQKLARFAASLGVSVAALKAYGVGRDHRSGCYSWPMYDGRGRIVGMRIRSEDGEVKACVPGSSNGLFVPEGYKAEPLSPELKTGDPFPLLLLLPEGPTDAAAAWDLGIVAVGRPNGSSGVTFVQELLVNSVHRQEVVVVGENDGPVWPNVPDPVALFPGVSGALACVRGVLEYAGTVKLVMPPRPAKDFRDWRLAGATAADVALAAGKAAKVDAAWPERAELVLERRKREAVALFHRMAERLASLYEAGEVARAERLRGWMRRRGYPIDSQRRSAA